MLYYKFVSKMITKSSSLFDASDLISHLPSEEQLQVCLFQPIENDNPFDYYDKLIDGSTEYLVFKKELYNKFELFLQQHNAVKIKNLPKLKCFDDIAGNPKLVIEMMTKLG